MKQIALVITLGLFLAALAGLNPTGSRGTTEASTQAIPRALEEQQILSATVRFVVESWMIRPDEKGYNVDRTMGHGTVMAGRYLVTHNHFDVPLSLLNRPGDQDSSSALFLYDSQGELLHRGPFADFRLAYRDTETLVFVHEEADFFTRLGVSSASFSTWTRLALEPGTEVAQVDWDSVVARVDWVNIEEAYLQDGTPRLVLDDGVLPGASGGGIFYEGVHIANNWRFSEQIDGSGSIVDVVTEAALNSAALVDLP